MERNRVIRLAAVTNLYDSSGSSVTETVSDSLSFHADLLTEAGNVWRRLIQDQIAFTDKAASALSLLAGELAVAAGKREIKNKKVVPALKMQAAEAVKAQYYFRVDAAFRKWLLKPEAGQSAAERDRLCAEWREEALRIVRAVGREEVDKAGPAAMLGRWIEEDRKGVSVKQHYSTAEAYNRFNRKLKKLAEGGV